jgi:hypothetical protein
VDDKHPLQAAFAGHHKPKQLQLLRLCWHAHYNECQGHRRHLHQLPAGDLNNLIACLQYQKDIQTKLKPGDFADRIDDKPRRLADAPDWQTVLRLFVELGENTDR